MIAAEDTAWLPFAVVVLLGALFVFWVAVIAEVASTAEADFRSGTKTTWLLITVIFGAFGAFVYLMAGRPQKAVGTVTPMPPRDSVGASRWDEVWASHDREASSLSGGPGTGSVPASPEPERVAEPQDSPTSSAPEYKTCPDCAEEVRAAAGKCRFCGFLFAPSAASV